MATVHHDSTDGKTERGRARATPQELAAARMREATLGLRLEQSQITVASLTTTLSVQSSTNALTPESPGNWSNSSVDSSCTSLWPSVKKLRGSSQPEPNKDDSVMSDVSSTTQAYKSLWLSARKVSPRSSLATDRVSTPSPQDPTTEETELPSAVQRYTSLWPSMKKVKSSASKASVSASGGLTPSDVQSPSASGISSYISLWPKSQALLDVGGSRGDGGQEGGGGSEVSLQSSSALSDMDFLSEDSSAC